MARESAYRRWGPHTKSTARAPSSLSDDECDITSRAQDDTKETAAPGSDHLPWLEDPSEGDKEVGAHDDIQSTIDEIQSQCSISEMSNRGTEANIAIGDEETESLSASMLSRDVTIKASQQQQHRRLGASLDYVVSARPFSEGRSEVCIFPAHMASRRWCMWLARHRQVTTCTLRPELLPGILDDRRGGCCGVFDVGGRGRGGRAAAARLVLVLVL